MTTWTNPSVALLARIEAAVAESNRIRAETTGFGIPGDPTPGYCVHHGRAASYKQGQYGWQRCGNRVKQPGLCHRHAKRPKA